MRMPWVRQISTVAITLATALLVYSIYVCLALRQIMRVTACPVTTSAGRRIPPGYIECCGYLVPVWAVVLLWCILPGTWAVLEIYYKLRRRRRDKLDLCLECGYRLKSHRGHCPGCGVRVGVGLSPRRYALRP